MTREKLDALSCVAISGEPPVPVYDSGRSCSAHADRGGFTLIEVMITCAIIAILAAIAYPSYTEFVLRGKLVEPTNALGAERAVLEQFYQDNRTYANVGAIISPCDITRQPQLKDFTVTCTPTSNPERYTVTAAGKTPATIGFSFSITNANVRSSTAGAVWGSTSCPTTWVMKKGDPCL